MTTRKAEEIEPVFAQNLEKGDSATSIFHPFSLRTRSNDVLVGTIRGRLLLFALDTLEKSHVLHEDPTKRQIVALGIWLFGEPTDQPIVCWLHFRGSAIALFQLSSSDGELNCLPMRELPTAHYGFCRALADRNNNRMFIPDHEDLSNVLRIRFKNSGEVLLQLGEEFLSKSWPTKRKEATSTDEHPKMFKGMLMGIETLETATDHVILMAFEDSTIFLFNFRTKAVVDALKHPKHQEFLCWSVANAGEQTTLIFVSVVQQLFLLSHSAANNTGQEQLRVECVIRRCKSDNNCTSIACAYDSTSGECRMAAGLKDGTIQIYFLPSSSTTDAALNVPPCWSHPQLLQLSNFHANTIQSLTWILPSLPKDQQSTGISTPANYSQLSKQKRQSTKMSPAMTVWLCSGSADEKFAFFELPSSPSSNYLPISDSNR